MDTFNFDTKKYGRELLLDCGQISQNKSFVQDDRPFWVTFYEIIFMIEGRGKFRLDDEIIPFAPGTVLLLPPNKQRQWYEVTEPFDGIYLVFEEEFVSRVFQDSLYLYRLHYFYNARSPSYLQLSDSEYQNYRAKLSEIQSEIYWKNKLTGYIFATIQCLWIY